MDELSALRKELAQVPSMRVGVRAVPNKPRTTVKKIVRLSKDDGHIWFLYMDIAARPQRGEANKELCTFLTKLFSDSTVQLTSGLSSKEKYIVLSPHQPHAK